MKKIILYSTFLVFIFGAACKKEKQDPSTPATDPVLHGGELMLNRYFLIDHDTVQSMNDLEAVAHFTGPNVIDYLSVNSVTMNGTTLLMNAGGLAGYYKASVKSAPTWNWSVKGDTGVPDFDYTNTTALPSFTEFASLPKTIEKNQNFVISLKGVANATLAYIKINDGSNPVSKVFPNLSGASNIQIPAAELAGLTQVDALVEIGFQNNSTQQVNNNRTFVFQNSIVIRKHMKIN